MTAIVCSVNVNGYINITTWIFICGMINTTINKHHMFETVIPCFNQSMLIVVFDHNFFFLKKWTPSTSVKSLVLLVFNIVYIILITSTCYRYVKLFFDSTTSLDYRKSPLQCYLSKTPSDYIGDSTFPVKILHIYPNCGNLALLGFWFYRHCTSLWNSLKNVFEVNSLIWIICLCFLLLFIVMYQILIKKTVPNYVTGCTDSVSIKAKLICLVFYPKGFDDQ